MLGVSQIWQPQVEKLDANAICIMFCVLWISKSNMCAHFLFSPANTRFFPSMTSETAFWAIIGFNETVRNWHEERYFTSSSRGIGIQFSTSNNTTSLNDHWLVYRHCAKLRKRYRAEKCPSSYKQATSLSPNQSASYMHLFSSTRKAPKQIGINENRLKCKRSKPTWFCRPSTELQRNREQRFKGWCHLPWLSDVGIPKFSLWARMKSSDERD